MSETKTSSKITIKDLWNTFWRWWLACEMSNSYESMQSIAYCFAMIPVLKKLYPDKEEASAALKRHTVIFNTTPAIVTFITGVAIAMEEKLKKAKENGEEGDPESVNAVKTALMGPLAGIGDSFFWGTFRIIGAAIGCSLAAQGSILGVIMFLLIYNIPHLLVRYFGLKIGYQSGMSFLGSMSEGGVIAALSEVAKVLGLVVVGSMCASMVNLASPLVFNIC